MRAPIGTDTALLFLVKLPSLPALLITKEPGPVRGALSPLAGKPKLSALALRPGSPGFRKNGPTLPPAQAQNRSTATPCTVSKPAPPSFTVAPCTTTVSTLLVAKFGSELVAASPLPLISVKLGMPAAAEPCSRAGARLEARKPLSVLTTWTATKPCPRLTVGGTAMVSCAALLTVGIRGPALTGPAEVATKKFASAPALKA